MTPEEYLARLDALMADGSVRCWGRNAAGEVGDGSTVDRPSPTSVPGVRGATGIAAGTTFTCILAADKTVQCWGTGRLLGDGGDDLLDLAATSWPEQRRETRVLYVAPEQGTDPRSRDPEGVEYECRAWCVV